MAKLATTTLSVTVTGDGVNETYIPPTAPVANATAPAGGPLNVALSSGDNVISVPPGAQGLIFVPPSASAVAKKLKGIAGDTGFLLSATLPSMLSLPSGQSTILINAASAETVSIHWV